MATQTGIGIKCTNDARFRIHLVAPIMKVGRHVGVQRIEWFGGQQDRKQVNAWCRRVNGHGGEWHVSKERFQPSCHAECMPTNRMNARTGNGEYGITEYREWAEQNTPNTEW